MKTEQRQATARRVLRVAQLLHRELKDVGEDLRPGRRERAAAIELESGDVTLGEPRDALLHPAEVERHAFEHRPRKMLAGRLQRQVQEAASHQTVFGGRHRAGQPRKEEHPVAARLDRRDGALQRGEPLDEAVIPEAVAREHEALEEVLERAAADSPPPP